MDFQSPLPIANPWACLKYSSRQSMTRQTTGTQAPQAHPSCDGPAASQPAAVPKEGAIRRAGRPRALKGRQKRHAGTVLSVNSWSILRHGALPHLRSIEDPVSTFNLGTGVGTSVRELVGAFEHASGRAVQVKVAARRPGDVAVSYADPSLAEATLGWKATRSIADICADAWRWQSRNPSGCET